MSAAKPSHIAHVISKVKNPAAPSKAFWHEVGAVWPHARGKGFDVVLFDQISVSGRIVCVANVDDKESE